jgi:phosphatidylglycerophosphate synthase
MTRAPSPEFSEKQLPLAAWSRAQALAMGASVLACAWLRAAWPVVVLALPSLLGLLWLGRGAFTPSGRFGTANAVTALRALLILGLVAPPSALPPLLALTLVGVVLLLDLLDGALARRLGDASLFGAHFDMETDALLVLVLTLRLWLGDGFGAWVLVSGLLRYAYVLWLWLWPGSGREAPRSRLGRSAFALLMCGLSSGLVLRGAWGAALVCAGTLVVSASFARSCYFSRLAS